MSVGRVAPPSEQHIIARLKPPGVFVCMAFDQNRIGRADQRRDLDDVPDLLDQLDRSPDWIAAIRLEQDVLRRRHGQDVDRFRRYGKARLAANAGALAEPSADEMPEGRVEHEAAAMRCRDAAGDQSVAADELGDEQRLWPRIELIGRADLLDAPGVHHDDAVGERQRLRLRVRDEDEGDAEAALQQLQFVLDALAQIGVERAERLVEQQNVGLDDKGASEGDTLLLAAGEPVRLGEVFDVARTLRCVRVKILPSITPWIVKAYPSRLFRICSFGMRKARHSVLR